MIKQSLRDEGDIAVKVTGDAVVSAPVERVFAALTDPAVLARTIPGVEQLEEVGPDRFRVTVVAGVASIKGAYAGEVALSDQQPPSSFRLRARGAGAPGTVDADVEVRLSPQAAGGGDGAVGGGGAGGTRVAYAADAVVGGVVGGVGQRVLAGVAKRTAAEFFRNVDDVLAGRSAPAAAAGVPVPVGADAGGTPGGSAPQADSAGVAPRVRAGAAAGGDAGSVLRGALAGAAIALAGVAVGAAIARR